MKSVPEENIPGRMEGKKGRRVEGQKQGRMEERKKKKEGRNKE